jgi:hypothetical protein
MAKLQRQDILQRLHAAFERYDPSVEIFDFGDKLRLTLTVEGVPFEGIYPARPLKDSDRLDSFVQTIIGDLRRAASDRKSQPSRPDA